MRTLSFVCAALLFVSGGAAAYLGDPVPVWVYVVICWSFALTCFVDGLGVPKK